MRLILFFIIVLQFHCMRIEKWSSARSTKSTCKAKRENYLGLVSRSLRRFWRCAGRNFSPRKRLTRELLTLKPALTNALVSSIKVGSFFIRFLMFSFYLILLDFFKKKLNSRKFLTIKWFYDFENICLNKPWISCTFFFFFFGF